MEPPFPPAVAGRGGQYDRRVLPGRSGVLNAGELRHSHHSTNGRTRRGRPSGTAAQLTLTPGYTLDLLTEKSSATFFADNPTAARHLASEINRLPCRLVGIGLRTTPRCLEFFAAQDRHANELAETLGRFFAYQTSGGCKVGPLESYRRFRK